MRILLLLVLGLVSCSTPRLSESTLPRQVQLPPHRERSQYENLGEKWMISTQSLMTTQAGVEVLKKGGNLYDAFTAISFAIGVDRPHSTGIGGGGFVLFYNAKDKKVYSLDFRETAPHKAHSKMFLNDKGEPVADLSLTGGLAVATPGHVAGVLEIHKKYGRLPLKTVLAPAIRMAEEGIFVYPALHRATTLEKERLARFKDSKAIFLDPQGEPWPVGHKLIQKDLAKTLKRIAQQGSAGFYKGDVARRIVKTVKENQGIMTLKDLSQYKTKWRTPLKSTYHQYEIYSQPPPSSGGAHVIQILNTIEKDNLKQWGPQDYRSIHLTASAMQRAFYDRARYMGDPDFVKVPVEKITSKEYAQQVRAKLDLDKAKNVEGIQFKEESSDTTHFSLMDTEGNVIVSTQTINGFYGSAMVAEGTGIVLNNEMDDFAAAVGASNLFGAVGGANNLVEPLKRPLSSMSPTLVMKEQMPYLAVGTPSGTRIITCVAQTILNVLEYELPLWDAVSLTRFHHQWQPDQLHVENPGFTPETTKKLKELGYQVVEKDLGCRIQAIQRLGNTLRGVSDPREEGASIGE